MESSKQYLRDVLTKVALSEAFKKRTESYYQAKMSGLYGHDSGFEADLRSIVVIKLMEKIDSGAFVLHDYVAGKTEQAPPDMHVQKVLRWLVQAFQNECKGRIRSRLPRQANGRGGDKMLYGSSYRESDYAGGLTTEIDGKGVPLSTPADFMATLTQPDEDDDACQLDEATLRERITSVVGAAKVAIVEDRLNGLNDVALAKKYGGTSDKYRKMFARLKKKVRLEPKAEAKQKTKRQRD